MRVTEILYEMASLQPTKTGLGLPIYIGTDSVYGTRLPHNIPRIKIYTQFGEVPILIPQKENEFPAIPGSVKRRDMYKRRINTRIFQEIQNYVYKHRQALTDFYFQKITEPQLKQFLGIS